jgi:GT2 family glycosyltransferase
MTASPRLTVVVPTYNRRAQLDRVLRSLAAQRLDEPFDVIVVSDGSTDDTDEYLRSDRVPLPVRALRQENAGPSAARNLGIEHVTTDLVLFVDDDVAADPNLVAAHLRAHERHGEQAVVIGPMLNPPDHEMTSWVAWEQAMLAKQYSAMNRGLYSATARQFYTGNASLRTAHLTKLGGFDPTFRRAEDVELAFRLDDHGLRFHFEEDAVGYHYAERTYESWREIAAIYGRNDVKFARDLHRTQLYRWISTGYRRHHPAVRWLAMKATRSPVWRERSLLGLQRLVSAHPGRFRRRIVRYALSGVYAIEYHCGVADELGSADAFSRVVRAEAPIAVPDDHPEG